MSTSLRASFVPPLLAAVFAVSTLPVAQAADPAPEAAAPPPGAASTIESTFKTTNPGRPVDGSIEVTVHQLPAHLPWAALSPAQQAIVRKDYPGLPEGDEPPYPLGGLRDLVEPIAQGQIRIGSIGILVMDVLVGVDGSVQGVQPIRTPDNEIRRYVHRVAMRTKFKPALCAGQPCAGKYRLMVNFTAG